MRFGWARLMLVRLGRFRPVIWDGPLAVLLAGVLLLEAESESTRGYVSPTAGLIALMACGPIVLRHARPGLALVLTVAGCQVALATFKPEEAVVVPLGLVLYSVAVSGSIRRTVVLAVISVAVAATDVALFSDNSLLSEDVWGLFGVVLLPLAAGDAVRERRAYVAEREERYRRTERERVAEADRRVEQERLRIAREVHDVVAHAMVAINVQASVAAHRSERRPEAAPEALRDIKRVSGDALRDLRATLGVLRNGGAAAPVAPTPDLSTLEDLVEPLRAAGITVIVDTDSAHFRSLPTPLGAAAYRIVQEALTNVLRHSGSTTARVAIANDGDVLRLEVLDDGPAEDTRRLSTAGTGGGSGNGLRGMRERAAAVGGRVEVGPRDTGGWRVEAYLPAQPVQT